MLDNYILKEAHKKIIILILIGFFLDIFICSFLAKLAYAASIFLVFVFRNSNKKSFANPNILSLVDGELIAIDYKDGKSILHIDVSLCNKHILRAPIAGKLTLLEKRYGLNLDSNNLLSKKVNNLIKFKFNDLIITLLDGNFNVGTYLSPDNSDISQYEKIGVFSQGRVIIELNVKHNDLLKVGQKIKAGKTIII